MTRKECLDMAAQCVLQDRASEYGGVEDNFRIIANFWSIYLGRKVYPADVAMMMALLKVARIRGNKAHADSFVDLAGYAACGAECAGGTPSPAPKDGDEFVMLWKHKPEAKSGCCQNGNDQPEHKAEGNCFHSGNSSEFQPGDPVEWFCFRREDAVTGWHSAFYLCKSGDTDYHIVQGIDGRYHAVHYANLRNPEAEFKPGDKVEALSFDGSRWEDAVVERTEVASGQWHCTVRLASGERHCLPVAGSIRRPPKAEGCEDLEYRKGDAVEFYCFNPNGNQWRPAIYERKYDDDDEPVVMHVVLDEETKKPIHVYGGHLRKAQPKAEDDNAEMEPEYEPHERVQVRYAPGRWCGAEYVCRASRWGHVVFIPGEKEEQTFRNEDVRRWPKAEGCEELVAEPSEVERVFGTLKKPPFSEDRMRESMPGIVPQDAPATPEDVCRHIVESNPAVYGHPHKPTGEELAEMAEEEAHE